MNSGRLPPLRYVVGDTCEDGGDFAGPLAEVGPEVNDRIAEDKEVLHWLDR